MGFSEGEMAPLKLPNTPEITRKAIQIKNPFLRNAISECVGTFILLVSLASFSAQKRSVYGFMDGSFMEA